MNLFKKLFTMVDFTLALFMFICGVAVWIGSLVSIPPGRSQWFPVFIGAGMTLMAGYYCVSVVLKTLKGAIKPPPKKEVYIPWYKSLLLVIAYALGTWQLGFVITTWLAVFAFYILIAQKEKKKLVMIAFPTVFTILVYVIFARIFYVRLPIGEIPRLILRYIR